MARALIYLPDSDSRPLAAAVVAGRSLAVRALVCAFRAGADVIVAPLALKDRAVERQLERMPALARAVTWLDPADLDAPPSGAEPWLLIPVSAVVDVPSLRALLDPAPPTRGAVLAGSDTAGGPVLLAPARLASRMWKEAAGCQPVGPELSRYVADAGPEPRAAPGVLVVVKNAAEIRRAERALYRRVGISADSGVDRLLHRRCSHWITRLLVRTPATPNQVSLLSLLIGCAAIWCFWGATPVSAVWGLVLYALACVVDHSDGEVARLTFQESSFGAHLDWVIDNVIHAGVVLGIGLTPRGPVAIAIGVIAAVGVALSAWFARILPHEIEVGEAVGGALKDMGNRDLFYLLLLGFVLFRWTAPLLLLPLGIIVAIGSQMYWIACVDRIRRSRARGAS